MSQFQIPIASDIRSAMTIRNEDMRLIKRRVLVRIEEELDDVTFKQGERCQYVLGVVCMSSDADLHLIMAAARHLGLLSRYDVERQYKEKLDEQYEKNFIEVRLECGYEDVCVGIDTFDGSAVKATVPIMLSLDERRRIWLGLFEAAGYKVRWGGTLNVRKTHI